MPLVKEANGFNKKGNRYVYREYADGLEITLEYDNHGNVIHENNHTDKCETINKYDKKGRLIYKKKQYSYGKPFECWQTWLDNGDVLYKDSNGKEAVYNKYGKKKEKPVIDLDAAVN